VSVLLSVARSLVSSVSGQAARVARVVRGQVALVVRVQVALVARVVSGQVARVALVVLAALVDKYDWVSKHCARLNRKWLHTSFVC
jgi:hypothetical protein